MRDWSSIEARLAGTRVLVVDRDPGTREVIVQWLRQAGCWADSAASFAAARRALDVIAPDVLVVDVRLGAYNGLHLVISGRARNPQMRGIVTTAGADPGLADEARRHDAGYLVKPFDRGTLLHAVADILNRPFDVGQPS